MRVRYGWPLAALLFGCNGILGIEEARLGDASAAGAGGDGGASGAGGSSGAGGGACSLTAPDPCNQCVASRCCDAYEACAKDTDCSNALQAYNVCVGIDFTNDAGGTCDETLGASANQLRANLATCAFQRGTSSTPPGCSEVCAGKPVGGSICSDYCTCATAACPDKGFDASCLSVCAAFTEAQLTCRPYHCTLAKTAKDNNKESDRVTHCGHTFGESLCP
jgi:hypothetical protein